MKELMEKRVELMDQMNAIVTAAETETRSDTQRPYPAWCCFGFMGLRHIGRFY